MGYLTEYTLEVDCCRETYDLIVSRISEISGYDSMFTNCDGVKWYNHEECMRAISKEFPSLTFTLEGVGEEHPDVWVKYFLDGKMQSEKAVITLPPFSALKLR